MSKPGSAWLWPVCAAAFAACTTSLTIGQDDDGPDSLATSVTAQGLTGEYYQGTAFQQRVLTRVDPVINFSLRGTAIAPQVGGDNFSVRWTGKVKPRFSETYTFSVVSDDGVRLWVNDQLLVDNWTLHGAVENSGQVALLADQAYAIRLEFYQGGGWADCVLSWSSPSQPKQVVPTSQLETIAPAQGLLASYYDGIDFGTFAASRVEPGVQLGALDTDLAARVGPDTYSVVWEGQVLAPSSETYTFYTRTDDGVRLWVNGQKLVDNWNVHGVTEDQGAIALTAGAAYDIRLEFFQNHGATECSLWWSSPKRNKELVPAQFLVPMDPTSGLRAEYFADVGFRRFRLSRVERTVNHSWEGAAPAPGMPADHFSVRWTGKVTPRSSGLYSFSTVTDDGVRLWVNGQKLIDNWTLHAPTQDVGQVQLTAGTAYDVVMEFYEAEGGATAQLYWASPGQPPQIIPASALTAAEPTTTDVTVAFISREPKMDFVWGSTNPTREGWPTVGQPVTWQAHIRTWSEAPLAPVAYRWLVDGAVVATGTVRLAPNAETTVDLARHWSFERHWLSFQLDADGALREVEKANNELGVFTDAISLALYVEQGLYDDFHQHQWQLGVGSNGFEDWAQRQVRMWNEKFAAAVSPDDPKGVLDRIRLDRVVVVADHALPLAGGVATNNPNLADRSVDLQWGFPSQGASYYSDRTTVSEQNPSYYEGTLIHELLHARYLLDSYALDVNDDGKGSTVAVREGGQLVAGSVYLPFISGPILYFNAQGGMMSGDYGRVDPYSAHALNLIAGRRAVQGNWNAPGNVGSYIFDLPAENRLTVKDEQGRPLPGASVSVFRAVGRGNSLYDKLYDNVADMVLTADAQGRVLLGKNPFAPSAPTIWELHPAGTPLVRVGYQGRVGYAFIEISRFNQAYWRGQTQLADHELRVVLH